MLQPEGSSENTSNTFLQDMINVFSKQVSPTILMVDKNVFKMKNGNIEIASISPDQEAQYITQIQTRIKKLMGERTLDTLMNQLYSDLRKY
jgi:hypothetical protein